MVDAFDIKANANAIWVLLLRLTALNAVRNLLYLPSWYLSLDQVGEVWIEPVTLHIIFLVAAGVLSPP